mgnify:CR=1 FL=1
MVFVYLSTIDLLITIHMCLMAYPSRLMQNNFKDYLKYLLISIIDSCQIYGGSLFLYYFCFLVFVYFIASFRHTWTYIFVPSVAYSLWSGQRIFLVHCCNFIFILVFLSWSFFMLFNEFNPRKRISSS